METTSRPHDELASGRRGNAAMFVAVAAALVLLVIGFAALEG
jgi:hypothetical protein